MLAAWAGALQQRYEVHDCSFKDIFVFDSRFLKVFVMISPCIALFWRSILKLYSSKIYSMAEVLPEATTLIDMSRRSIWAMSFSHALVIHTHHSSVAIDVIGRAMTAAAQTWWLAVDEVCIVLGEKSISSRDDMKTILIGQTALDDV